MYITTCSNIITKSMDYRNNVLKEEEEKKTFNIIVNVHHYD
jgi:hypothetical protein